MNLEKWRKELEAKGWSAPDWPTSALLVDDALAILERACAEEREEAMTPLVVIEQRATSILQSMLYTPPWGESASQFSTLIQGLSEQIDALKHQIAAKEPKP